MTSQVNSTKHLRVNACPSPLVQKTEPGGTLSNSFYEVSILLIPNQNYKKKKDNCKPVSLMNLPGMQEYWVQSLGQEDPLEKELAIHSSSLENPMDRGTCWAEVHGVTNSWTRLSD